MQISLVCSGSNAHGQLATLNYDDLHTFRPASFVECPLGQVPARTQEIVDISCGANHTVALLRRYCNTKHRDVMEVWGCGDGSRGQLGPGYTKHTSSENFSRAIFRPLELSQSMSSLADAEPRCISAAWETTFVTFARPGDGDVVVAMGANEFGELGIPPASNVRLATNVVEFGGISVKGRAVNPRTIRIQSVASSLHHVLVHFRAEIDDVGIEDLVVGWGAARHGQLGAIPKVAGKAPAFHAKPLLISTANDLPVSVAAGHHHTVIRHKSGRVSSCGSNRKDQLLGLDDVSKASLVGCTWNGTYVVEDTNILATGSHNKGQLGRNELTETSPRGLRPVCFPNGVVADRVLKISCGSEHVLILLQVTVDGHEKSEVWGWGWNEHGNLGNASTDDAHTPMRLFSSLSPPGAKVAGIWAGCGTSWVATKVETASHD
ncbi:hypothetical protein HGRIS_008596 [Hohenbuehelia grisea]|uniref:Uncharacterized protein n=1 Tax=Hohenbuehelia grisea TaxID=104357 RepID=A0ABR3J8Y8_9AGAR